MVLMMLTFGKYDLALVDLRVLTIAALLLGALCVLPGLEKNPLPEVESDGSPTHKATGDNEDLSYGSIVNTRPMGPMPF